MSAVVIIPAFNEEETIANVVRAAVEADVGPVLVASDGSTDNTSREAMNAGADVMNLSPNAGKGNAMLAGVTSMWLAHYVDSDIAVFLDADLIGLRPEHVRRLVESMALGKQTVNGAPVMVCGLRDYGPILNKLQLGMPRITGERAVRLDVLKRVPPSFWQGFRIEAGINRAAELMGRVESFVMDGVSIRTKWAKTGDDGFKQATKMTFEVMQAIDDARREIV